MKYIPITGLILLSACSPSLKIGDCSRHNFETYIRVNNKWNYAGEAPEHCIGYKYDLDNNKYFDGFEWKQILTDTITIVK